MELASGGRRSSRPLVITGSEARRVGSFVLTGSDGTGSDLGPIDVAMGAGDDAVVGGVGMDYLPLMVILGGVSACAFVAYELFDAIERDEYERPSASSGRARVAVLDAEPPIALLSGRPRRTSAQATAKDVERGAGVVRPDADQLDARIHGLEARLERLEGECNRICARALGVRA
jgi:hypothetical protein